MKCELDPLGGGGKKPREWKMAISERNLNFFLVIKISERWNVF